VSTSEVKCSWVKCSVGLSNRVCNIIIRHIRSYEVYCLIAFRLSRSFVFFWLHFLSFYAWLSVLCASVSCVNNVFYCCYI
jgi:hypothetical protein